MKKRGKVADKVREASKSHKVEDLHQQLNALGCHLTRQREAVYEYLSGVEHHPTAEEIFLSIKHKLPK
ncbi:MAG: hypothetical protein AB1489_42090, partial [Acidobacteriota bacterium]